MTIFHGQLLLEDQKPRDTINLPVDLFLRSLAEDQGEHAVAVILSGTGSDGTRGVRAIKEWGGLVVFHDTCNPHEPGVRAVFDAIQAKSVVADALDIRSMDGSPKGRGIGSVSAIS
jgi:chemotaxis response regulator CheB